MSLTLGVACAPPPDPVCGNGEVEAGEGCDDGNTVHYDACDRNCQVPDCLVTWYEDIDEDGIGGAESEISCNGQRHLVETSGDCDDEDPSVGLIRQWYSDRDGDGLGDPDEGEASCEPPQGYVPNDLDSNDDQSDISGCWKDVSAGRNHTCGLKTDGSITCWGDPEGGRTEAPAGNDFASITAGYTHTCALRTNGRAECWGRDAGSILQPPNFNFDTLDCGLNFCCGTVGTGIGNARCWGRNDEGQATPRMDQEFVKISAADSFHTCGLTTDDSIVCWGKGDENSSLSPTGAPPRMLFSDASAGGIGCGVTFSGRIHCWGASAESPEGEWMTVDVTTAHACGLKTDRTIGCWGTETFDRTAHPQGGRFQLVDTSQLHSCALRLKIMIIIMLDSCGN